MSKWFCIFFLLISVGMTAQEADSLTVRIDSSSIAVKHFKSEFKDRYTERDFNYDDSLEGKTENFIARGLNWFFSKVGELFGIQLEPETLKLMELITYILLIIMAIFLVAKLLSGQDAGSFFSKKNTAVNRFDVKEEHIERIDFDALIEEALLQDNYRLALRYRFLKLLKELSVSGIIKWHYDKTNTDYYQEIESEVVKKSFKEVSYLYDYVWYGEFMLDEQGFKNAQARFEQIGKSLNHAK